MRLMINSAALRTIMGQRGMTAEDIGRAANVSARHVRGLAAGHRPRTSEPIARELANALNVPLELITTSTGVPATP